MVAFLFIHLFGGIAQAPQEEVKWYISLINSFYFAPFFSCIFCNIFGNGKGNGIKLNRF